MEDDDYTMGELFGSMRQASQDRRAANRASSAQLLADAGIPAETRNGGAHLIVAGAWDFWPGTGKWKERGGGRRSGRGVFGLIRLIKPPAPPQA